jgi:hypothetical protein
MRQTLRFSEQGNMGIAAAEWCRQRHLLLDGSGQHVRCSFQLELIIVRLQYYVIIVI